MGHRARTRAMGRGRRRVEAANLSRCARVSATLWLYNRTDWEDSWYGYFYSWPSRLQPIWKESRVQPLGCRARARPKSRAIHFNEARGYFDHATHAAAVVSAGDTLSPPDAPN